MSTESIFIAAIHARRRLAIRYSPGDRVIEPHAIGVGSSGQILIRAFQTECVSASGKHVNWKLLRLDRVELISDTEQVFAGPRPQYKRGDRAMTRGIISEL
jgi:hypothetical protein